MTRWPPRSGHTGNSRPTRSTIRKRLAPTMSQAKAPTSQTSPYGSACPDQVSLLLSLWMPRHAHTPRSSDEVIIGVDQGCFDGCGEPVDRGWQAFNGMGAGRRCHRPCAETTGSPSVTAKRTRTTEETHGRRPELAATQAG